MTPAEQFDQATRALASQEEPAYSAMSLLPTAALLAAATGELDLNVVARAYLAGRGLGPTGDWVGFPTATDYWRSQPAPGDIAAARRAGRARSEKKAAAARENGKKGGNWRKSVPTIGQEEP